MADEIPIVTILSLLRTVFWNRWSAFVNGLLAIIGALDIIDTHLAPKHPEFKAIWDRFYALPRFTWQTSVVLASVSFALLSLRGAYQFALDYRKRFERMIKHKLIFEIDERSTTVELVENQDKSPSLGIRAKIRLRFENKDLHPMSMKRLNLTLHELQANKQPREFFTTISFRYSMDGTEIKRDDFEGMMVQDRRLTPFYLVDAFMLIDDENIKSANDLTGIHFLRLTMDAGEYQSPFRADLFLGWKHALETGGTALTITMNAPAIRMDYRRIE